MDANANWITAVARYAGDRQVCNCGRAYYTNCGRGFRAGASDGASRYVTDLPVCAGGCMSAQLEAQDHVIKCALRELPKI